MKNIVHLLSSGGYSGAENIAINIIKNTPNQFDSAYLSINGPIEAVLVENNVQYFPLKRNSLKSIYDGIKVSKANIIYAHDFKASIKACLISFGKPVVSHIHQNPDWFSKMNVKTILFLFSTIFMKKIVYVSQETRDEYVFSKLIRKKSVVLENYVDSENVLNNSFKKIDGNDEQYDICFLGRLEQVKNPKMFLEVVNILKKRKKDIKALVIGTGSLVSELETYVIDKDLSGNVTFVGYQKNPYNYLSKSKILLITSIWEGFGLNAIEANILNIPVLATPVGGLKSIVTKENGFFCENTEEFVEKTLLLLNSKKLYERMKNNMKNDKTIYTDATRWRTGIKMIVEGL